MVASFFKVGKKRGSQKDGSCDIMWPSHTHVYPVTVPYWLERICRSKHKRRGSYKDRGIRRRQRSWCHFRNHPPQMGSSLSPNQWVTQLQKSHFRVCIFRPIPILTDKSGSLRNRFRERDLHVKFIIDSPFNNTACEWVRKAGGKRNWCRAVGTKALVNGEMWACVALQSHLKYGQRARALYTLMSSELMGAPPAEGWNLGILDNSLVQGQLTEGA